MENISFLPNVITENKRGLTTTSIMIAKIFGKEHKNVLRDIESFKVPKFGEIENFNAPKFEPIENFNQLKFEPIEIQNFVNQNFLQIEYMDRKGRNQKAYEMTKDGFSFLVMSYTGAKANYFKVLYINEFNRKDREIQDLKNEITKRLVYIKPTEYIEIIDFPKYSLKPDGTIYSIKRNIIIKVSFDRYGYLFVKMTDINGKRKNKKIHRLLAEHFIANPNKYSVVNHINGIKTDNRLENLEWTTQKLNLLMYQFSKNNQIKELQNK